MSTRFVSVELSYGCQRARVEVGTDGRPCVVAGPNGSGKTTLIEGIVRTLYGFNRKRPDDRTVAGRREPWEGGAYTGRVVIESADGDRLEVSRDFATDHVTVLELHAATGESNPVLRFDGTASSGSSGRPAESYRAILDAWLGFSELEDYRRTMCIEQGELASTELAEHLLQLAAGGHAALDAAKDTVRTAFRTLTREPMDEEDRRRPKDKQLESVRKEIVERDVRLRIAREIEKSRQPLRQEERDLNGRVEGLTGEIHRLEDALDPLATLDKLRDQCATLDERVQRLERSQLQLGERLEGLRRASEEWSRISAEPLYPGDFPQRLAVLRGLWRDESESVRELEAITGEALESSGRARVPYGLIAVGVIALAATMFGNGALLPLLIVVGSVSLVAGGFLTWYGRVQARVRERRLSEAEARHERITARITEQIAGVPNGDTLTAESDRDRSERYDAQLRALAELKRLRASVDELLGTIEAELPRQGELALAQGPAPEEVERADVVSPALDHEVSRTRTELAQRRIELERAEAVTIQLPDGLEPSFTAVRAALDQRRSEHRDVAGRLAELRRRLLEAESGESPLTLADEVDELRIREAELVGETGALRFAFDLLTDAYTEFRAGDQERLLEAVSTQLEQVSGGALGPVATDSVLEAAHVVVRGRKVPLASPPLSFGELHAVLLAVRLGAADFLAGSGHRAPLLIDEPFTYLDDERAAQVWAQLQEVAGERQTIITTQARRLLSHLDVEPDVLLEAPGVIAGR